MSTVPESLTLVPGGVFRLKQRKKTVLKQVEAPPQNCYSASYDDLGRVLQNELT